VKVLTTQNFIGAERPKQGVSGKGRYIRLYRYYGRQIAEGSTVIREVVVSNVVESQEAKNRRAEPRAGQPWRSPIVRSQP
jgi:hypothetical protein